MTFVSGIVLCAIFSFLAVFGHGCCASKSELEVKLAGLEERMAGNGVTLVPPPSTISLNCTIYNVAACGTEANDGNDSICSLLVGEADAVVYFIPSDENNNY